MVDNNSNGQIDTQEWRNFHDMFIVKFSAVILRNIGRYILRILIKFAPIFKEMNKPTDLYFLSY